MSDESLDFDAASRLRPTAAGRLGARVDASWGQGKALFGGIQAALLVRALESVVSGDGRSLRTLAISFCRAAEAGELELDAGIDREGRNVTHAHARLLQGDGVVATALATFARDRDDARAWNEATPPQLPPPAQLERLVHPLAPVFLRHFDVRFVDRQAPFAGGDEPQVTGWVRFGEPVPIDAAALAALLDVWPPAVLATLAEPRPSTSVDLRYDLLTPPPIGGLADDDYLAFRCRVLHWHGGHGVDEGEVWTRDGRPVARIRQLRAVF